MNVYYLFFLFFITLFLRSLYRIIYPKMVNFDTYFHLLLIEHIRSNSISNFIEKKRFIKPFSMNYPWMTHFIFSLFPKGYERFLERFFNPILDALFVSILYYVAYYLTQSNKSALMLSCLYVFTPATFSMLGTGPRLGSFTPRLFAEIIGSLVLILEYLYLIQNSDIYLIGAIFFMSLLYLSSKFAVQALIFLNVFIILFSEQYSLILVPFFGLVLALLYSKGHYWYILKEQAYHLRWYFKENLQGKMAVSDRNSLRKLYEALKNKNFKQAIYILLFKNSYFIVVYKMPILLFVTYYILQHGVSNISYIEFFIFSGLIVFFVSSLRWFLFIGEAERYLNYVLFFIILYFVNNYTHDVILYGLIFYGVIYYILDFLYLSKLIKKDKNNKNKLLDWLNKQPNQLSIATIPYHIGGWRVVKETQHNWLYANLWIDKDEKDFFDKNFLAAYPYIDINKADKIIEYYNLDYIIYDKRAVANFFKKYEIPPTLKQIQISENLFALYK